MSEVRAPSSTLPRVNALILLVLAANPSILVSPTELRLNGEPLVMGDERPLNLPSLEAALRKLSPEAQALPCEVEVSPEVRAQLLMRALFSCSVVNGHPSRVRVGRQPAIEAKLVIGAHAGDKKADVDGTWVPVVVEKDVTAERLATILDSLKSDQRRFAFEWAALKGGTLGQGGPVTGVEGSLDKAVIKQVIHAHREGIQTCFAQARTVKPKLEGKVAVKIEISAEGRVVSAEPVTDEPQERTLTSCILTEVKTWVFPKPKGGGKVVVTYPFVFKEK